MSVARREASAKYPIFVAPQGNAGRDWVPICDEENSLTLSKRSGYEAGRTAEPTEAEIEAGAMAIFRTLITSAHTMSDSDYAEAWNCIAIKQKDQFKRQSQAVLEAARKAVTE